MLEEMWQDRVSIAPEEQREIEREQQQQKEAVKALKRENEAQEALLHDKAQELETALTAGHKCGKGSAAAAPLWAPPGRHKDLPFPPPRHHPSTLPTPTRHRF